jgi:hypothetical protein
MSGSDGKGMLHVTQAVNPGNYQVVSADGLTVSCFSLNISANESQLGRVPLAHIEHLFGDGCVVAVDAASVLKDALQGGMDQPVELLPWVMMLVLLVLVAESVLAAKFYRQPTPTQTSD